MLKKNVGKKLTVSVLIMVIMMAMLAMPAGERQFDFISPDDYTVVTDINGADFDITVQGYLYSIPDYVSLTNDEKLQMDWDIDNTGVIDFTSNPDGSDTAEIEVVGEGTATITMTYTQPDTTTTSVTTYVEVEGSGVSSVSNIVVDVTGDTLAGLTGTYNVPLFDLNDVFGTTGQYVNVLQNAPTALHALLYALEVEYSTETNSTPIGSFDWNWVDVNVEVDSTTGYVSEIAGDSEYIDYETYDFYRWQYTVNTIDPGHAAGAAPLSNNDDVSWFFDGSTW